jgi:hypothetical protein
MGGTGKSVLAAALANQMQDVFPDGVYWLTIGEHPTVLDLQNQLYRDVTGETETLTSVQQAKSALGSALGGLRALVVLDDVWEVNDAAAFAIDSPQLCILITTRNSEILVGLGAAEHQLEVLELDDALLLLARWAGVADASALPPGAHSVAEKCGRLPLALAMVGAMARLKTSWRDILTRLQRADLDKIANRFPKDLYPYHTLLAAVGVSIDALDSDDRERYLDLAVFPDHIAIPQEPLTALWSMDEIDVRECMTRWIARSLATGDVSESSGTIRLHDLQRNMIRKERENTLTALHLRLVQAWDARPASLDAYSWRWIGYHLINANRGDDLRRRLLDGTFALNKLAATDFNALIADYDYFPEDRDLGLIQEAMSLSAHIVGRDPAQFASQLVGRLLPYMGTPAVWDFSQAVIRAAPRPWLRPLKPGLQQPETGLLRTLEGHGRERLRKGRVRDAQKRGGCSENGQRQLKHRLTGRSRNETAAESTAKPSGGMKTRPPSSGASDTG